MFHFSMAIMSEYKVLHTGYIYIFPCILQTVRGKLGLVRLGRVRQSHPVRLGELPTFHGLSRILSTVWYLHSDNSIRANDLKTLIFQLVVC